MTPAQLKDVEKLLLGLLAQLSSKASRKIDPNRQGDEDSGGDEDAQPHNEMEQVIASNRNRNDSLLLARVEAALNRLRENSDEFGACQECGDDIALPRLKAMPYAEYCVECQAKIDGPKKGPTRKKLTDYI